MMARARLSALAGVLALAACQSDGSGSPAAVAPLASAKAEASQPAAAQAPTTVATASAEGTSPTTGPTDANPTASLDNRPANVTARTALAGNASIEEGVRKIAGLYSARGDMAALNAVLSCYQKVQGRSATIAEAKVCAAQDFVVSRSVTDAYKARGGAGQRTRAVIVSERVAERIGALMQLKGMNQSEFNSFGLYLHQVAYPAFQRART